MKYGLSKESSPPETDEKSLNENSESEKKLEVPSVEPTVALKTIENQTEQSNDPTTLSIIKTDKTPESDSSSKLPVNESVDTSQSVSNIALDKPEINIIQATSAVDQIKTVEDKTNQSIEPKIYAIQTTSAVPHNNTTVVMIEDKINQSIEQQSVDKHRDNSETTPMICDVSDVNNTQAVMEVVVSNDDENSEVEMISEPATPNDIDMSENGPGEIVDSFVKSSVTYNFKNAPIIELSRYSWGANEQKYLRGCLFSPDGTCILTIVNKDGMHIIELPLSLYDNENVNTNRPLDVLTSAVHVPEGGTVYDYCWYPFMNSTLPETCCFISTRQHEPLQLWDAFDGKLRCTYRGYDAVDEVDAALSVCFSIDGSQVIAGYKKSLKIFRTDVPGRDYTNFVIKSPASCLAINRSDENMIAIGSWNSFVTFHDVRTPKLDVMDKLVKHTGGVTLMKFSSDGKRLITGARKDNKLLGWDVRNVTVPLFTLNRNVETNQKIYFDMSWSDQWLVSGDTNGTLHAFDLKYGTENGKFPDYQYPLHHDCCNGVSLHPSRPIVATTSGQHHFIGIEKDIALKSAELQENSLIFWWCGNSD